MGGVSRAEGQLDAHGFAPGEHPPHWQTRFDSHNRLHSPHR